MHGAPGNAANPFASPFFPLGVRKIGARVP